jgi:ribosomal protein S18 acetylase RimI-like enzyme
MTMTESPIAPNIAWVSSLGVRPAYRRRGVASALLGMAFAALQARGASGIGLGVDASNMTNAVTIYQRAGMTVAQQRDVYEKVLRPGLNLHL